MTTIFQRKYALSAGIFGLFIGSLSAALATPPRKPAVKSVAAPVTAAPIPTYNRDIRPLLAENCFACHGTDSAARKAGLRLDRFADAVMKRDDGFAIAPGNPKASLIIQRISLPETDDARMPPAEGHKALTAAQKALLIRWIAAGAKYEPHWAYIAPKMPALPTVHNAAWSRNAIDHFVLAKLEANGLMPAPEADKRTLIRRVSLDLTGLPPAPSEVEAFVADPSPNAYERLVDRYLADPRYGEHRARYWLDVARYGDTNGVHIDSYREMYSYRDWVIGAFNQNMPYSTFALDQLAGDLLPHPTLDQQIATGFIRCNITTGEGGSIDEEVKVGYTRDRTETFGQVFLGETVGCAVCHDHKFDPISQKEMYSLSAFFNNMTQGALDGNARDMAPTLPIPLLKDRARFDALQTQVPAAQKLVADRRTAARPDFDRWLANAGVGGAAQSAIAASIPTGGLRFEAPLNEGQGRLINATFDGKALPLTLASDANWDSGELAAKAYQRKAGNYLEAPTVGDFENNQGWTASAWVKLPANGNGGSILARMDDQHGFRGWDMWVQGRQVAMHIINNWPDNAVKAVTTSSLTPDVWHHVCEVYDGGMKKGSIRIYFDGVEQPTTAEADVLKSTIRTTVPFTIGQRHTTSGVDGTSIEDIRVYDRNLSATEVGNLATGTRASYLVARSGGATGATSANAPLTVGEKDELFSWWIVGNDPAYKTLTADALALANERNGILMRGTIAHIAQEKPTPAMAFVLNRGEYDQRRDPVTANVPSFLPPLPAGTPPNRLALAREVLLPNNPLTARVTVNRMWQELFGQGIVRTTGDFGIMGELPSDQPLLDYLAVDFRDHGWDVKRFYKQVVMSATYRQSALETPVKRLKDPANLLLSRGPRFRMDAEMVRDYALAASGELSPTVGGPSVKPYQPAGVWESVAMPESNTHFYKQDTGDALYRRSLYTFWKRAAPPASMDIFNAPTREVCTVRRERTDTPLQALVTLNDTQFIEAARVLGQRALLNGGTTVATRTDFLARRLLCRPLTAKEQGIVTRSVDELYTYYHAHPDDTKALLATGDSKPDPTIPPDALAAWTMLTNQMMNLDEVLNK